MSLTRNEFANLFVALAIILISAHVGAQLCARLRQPPVIGEILGGLLLGPTVFGAVAPGVAGHLFPATGTVHSGLQVLNEFGLLLLMFLAGREVVTYRNPGRQRTVAALAAAGLIIPMVLGVAAGLALDHDDYSGSHGTRATFALIFGIAFAVTSIPVISRIMLDLGLLNTSFARIVLAVALLEDVVLYVALAVTFALVQTKNGQTFGFAAWLELDGAAAITYQVVVSLLFIGVLLLAGKQVFHRLATSRANLMEKGNPVAFRLVFAIAVVLACVFLGINAVFGALLAGIASSDAGTPLDRPDAEPAPGVRAGDTIKQFSLAFFIPIYFAGVGMQLDLARNFDIVFFVIFFLTATAVKAFSVWAAARAVGETNRDAKNFAVALNARGGPGIVLATVTLSAGLINEKFFTSIVVLSIVTSAMAGMWLERAFPAHRRGPLDPAEPSPATDSNHVKRAEEVPEP
ncbi:cation:proton antiporter [Nocardia colli]|uniref:Cation:proton antiporter n=1 Tax=Nocardia colli TaxID=2545717 RepID=A0A5N0E765_9NOCA|nr:cation:proton antiporter [Nocardia colli]KAA8884783.1 cation:proton antiporter [Nocardia colli]